MGFSVMLWGAEKLVPVEYWCPYGIALVNGENEKNSLMGFVYRVVWVLEALWILLSETINFLRKLHKTNIFGMPVKILP